MITCTQNRKIRMTLLRDTLGCSYEEIYCDGVKLSVHSAESFQSLVSLLFELPYVSPLKELLLIQIPITEKTKVAVNC